MRAPGAHESASKCGSAAVLIIPRLALKLTCAVRGARDAKARATLSSIGGIRSVLFTRAPHAVQNETGTVTSFPSSPWGSWRLSGRLRYSVITSVARPAQRGNGAVNVGWTTMVHRLQGNRQHHHMDHVVLRGVLPRAVVRSEELSSSGRAERPLISTRAAVGAAAHKKVRQELKCRRPTFANSIVQLQ